MIESVKVRTVTFGRKLPIGRHGNAEYILTAEVRPEQTPEDVMASLRNMVNCQLAEIANEDLHKYEEA